jgi:alpha-tubulin suppressor-like RCC1 family protein
LGNGSEVDSATAVPVSGVSTAVAVATGDRSSCALLADGTVACWGEYSGGWFNNVVDHGPGGPAITVPGVSNAEALSMHGSRSCAVLADGSVMCWGTVADDGMTSSFTRRTTPVVARGLSSVVSLAVGQGHVCALLGSGSVQCWGANSNGQLGTGGQVFRVDGVVQTPPTYPSSTTPQNVVGLP